MSNTWAISHWETIRQPIAATDTVQNHQLGKRVDAFYSTQFWGQFIYMLGVASTAVGDFCTLNYDDFTTTRLVANAIGPVGIAMSANVASQYGWYQIYGKASGKALTAFADNGRCYATATAGSIDDTVVDGDLVHNCLGASAVNESTLLADFEIHYPYNDDIASND